MAGTTVRSDHREPVVPDGQWRAVPVRVIAPAGGAARQQFSGSCRAGSSGPAKPGTGSCPGQPARATASPPAAQAGNRTVGVRPAHPVRRQPGHGDYGLRHQPDRTAREITMNFVSIRIITGDVARLASSCEKATGVHEGDKEGGKR